MVATPCVFSLCACMCGWEGNDHYLSETRHDTRENKAHWHTRTRTHNQTRLRTGKFGGFGDSTKTPPLQSSSFYQKAQSSGSWSLSPPLPNTLSPLGRYEAYSSRPLYHQRRGYSSVPNQSSEPRRISVPGASLSLVSLTLLLLESSSYRWQKWWQYFGGFFLISHFKGVGFFLSPPFWWGILFSSFRNE